MKRRKYFILIQSLPTAAGNKIKTLKLAPLTIQSLLHAKIIFEINYGVL